MNRRSLFKALLGATAGAAVPAVATATSACRLEHDHYKLYSSPFQWLIDSNPSALWIVAWSGWERVSPVSDVLTGQSTARPVNEDLSRDRLRPLMHQTVGGVGGPYQMADMFRADHLEGFPLITLTSTPDEKDQAARKTMRLLLQGLIDRVNKVKWHE